MSIVQPKKSLGQHFLHDLNIANKIVESLNADNSALVLEIGPGTGILTKILSEKYHNLFVIDIDKRMIEILEEQLPGMKNNIIHGDIIKFDFNTLNVFPVSLVGNLPYNISSQVFFKLIENRVLVDKAVFMIQKEVAERIASVKGKKTYGILSVFLQRFFNIEYLFTVNESSFSPPPKVKSAVIRLTRKNDIKPVCDEKFYFRVVKTAFNQRRKMLSNSLKPILNDIKIDDEIMMKRPEQLSFSEFEVLTKMIEEHLSKNSSEK